MRYERRARSKKVWMFIVLIYTPKMAIGRGFKVRIGGEDKPLEAVYASKRSPFLSYIVQDLAFVEESAFFGGGILSLSPISSQSIKEHSPLAGGHYPGPSMTGTLGGFQDIHIDHRLILQSTVTVMSRSLFSQTSTEFSQLWHEFLDPQGQRKGGVRKGVSSKRTPLTLPRASELPESGAAVAASPEHTEPENAIPAAATRRPKRGQRSGLLAPFLTRKLAVIPEVPEGDSEDESVIQRPRFLNGDAPAQLSAIPEHAEYPALEVSGGEADPVLLNVQSIESVEIPPDGSVVFKSLEEHT